MVPRRPALFQRFEQLDGVLPFASIARAPSPVTELSALANRAGATDLWVKRDDKLSKRYGGNKVRKLEWIVGDALHQGAERLLTVGVVGSNHVLATTVHGQAHDLAVEAVQFPCPPSDHVRRSARAAEAQGVLVHWAPSKLALPFVLGAHRLQGRVSKVLKKRYYVPGGGSSAVGALGYVDAALELADQVDAGELPEPAQIFVASGTGGTQAGLLVGCALAGMKTQVIGVRVVDRLVCNARSIRRQAAACIGLLRRAGLKSALKSGAVRSGDIHLIHSAIGDGFGTPTRASDEAVSLAADVEQLPLDPIYTGKAMSAMLRHLLDNPATRKTPTLFWNTCSSARLERLTRDVDLATDGPQGYRDFLRLR